MSRTKVQAAPIPIIIQKRKRPESDLEIDQATLLRLQVSKMRIEEARIILNMNRQPPTVHLLYTGASAPEPFWALWLYARIIMSKGQNWFAHFTSYVPHRCEMYLTPRKDKGLLEELLANEAARSVTSISQVRLCVSLPHRIYLKDFDLTSFLH